MLSTLREAVSRISVRSFLASALFLPLLSGSLQAQVPRVSMQTRTALAVPAAVDSGLVGTSQKLTLTLTLKPTDERAATLDAFLSGLITPSSPNYRKWITPSEFAQSYGATADQLASANAWAQREGLTLVRVSPAANRLVVSGTSDKVQSAFAVSLHTYQLQGNAYFAPAAQPSLEPEAAALFTAVEGLTNLPAAASMHAFYLSAQGATPADLTPDVLGDVIDANLTSLLPIDSALCTADVSASQAAAYASEFRQAAAQGITVLSTRTCNHGGFPAALPEVTGVALSGETAETTATTVARSSWQSAPGLPADGLRHAPDLTVSSLAAFAQTLTQLEGSARFGNINPILYSLATVPGLYTQPDAAAAGTWEPATGLGMVDLKKLTTAFPRGVGQSFASFSASSYSPIHGQGTTFTSNVTSGTGGATPTGTVTFQTQAGTVLASAPLSNGTGSATVTTLDGGNYTVLAAYSGDGTYSSAQSPTAQLYVQPEPSSLSAALSGSPVIGSNYTLTVTDTAPSGVGQPTGGINVAVSGTSTIYTGTLTASGPASGSVTFSIPATVVGTSTLSITCTSTANYSCLQPYTMTVTVQKATPVLSISYTPNPPVSGANISLNAVVSTAGSAPAPTGNVRFFDNTTLLNASALKNGSTSTTGVVPTTATHSISATYDGDPNYNSITTTAGSTTSGTIGTSLSLTSSASVVTAGQNITFTATLTPAGTGPASPTGTVTFFDGATLLGTTNLSGNAATFTTNSLSSTTNHSITATYSGDGYYGTSSSTAVGLSASNSANGSTTTLTYSPQVPVHGQTITLTATVAPATGGPTPTGAVVFTSTQLGKLGQGTLQNGVATLATNQLPGGASTITASYGGDTTYNPSSSNAVSLNISPEPVTLALSVPANATFGQPIQVTVAVNGGSGVGYPTGTVVVQPQGTGYSASSSGAVTSSTVSGSGAAGVVVQALGAGAITFTATYTGDKSFASAGPVSTTANVAKVSSSTALSFTPTTPVSGQSTTLTAKVSFASAIGPTGSVQFLDGSTSLGFANLDSTGTATLTTVFNGGAHIVTASYAGDSNYLPSSSPARSTTTGTTASSTSITINPTSVTVGAALTLGATVTPTVNGTAPTGTVQFLGGGSVLCSATLTNGSGNCTYTPAAAGTVAVTGSYVGDQNYSASTSGPVSFTANNGGGSLIATVTPASAAGGTAATVTATVTAATGTVPSGVINVTVTNAAGTLVSSANTTLPGTGSSNSATVTLPITVPSAAGTYGVTVSCSNTNFTCSPVTLALVSTGASRIATITVLTASTSATATGATVLTASVTGVTAGTAAVSGTVVFYDGNTIVGTAPVTAGVASASVSLTGATHSLTAVYSGDTLYSGSVSAPVTSISAGSTTNVLLTANRTSGLAGSPIVFTVTLTGSTLSGAVPTGAVSFYAVGSTPGLIGTVTIGKSGASTATGVFSTANLPAGTTSVYAAYAGDASFATANSNSISLTLTDYTVTFTPQSLTLSEGKSGQTTLTLGSVNGFNGTVTFACSPPPNSQISCSFSPTTLFGGGNTILTVNTVGSRQASLREGNPGMRMLGGVSFAALLCCLLPGRRRRKLPALLLVLLGLALAANTGCSNNSFNSTGVPPTPLGTAIITVNTAGSDGVNTVKHSYAFPLTVQ